MSSAQLEVGIASRTSAGALARFADRQPLAWNDFASIALLMPEEPRVWLASQGTEVVAAAIDDGLAMSVAGEPDALRTMSRQIPGVRDKLVIAGRSGEVAAFVEQVQDSRRERHEHLMAVARGELLVEPEALPIRIADSDDLPLLAEVRARALEEEYGIRVDRHGKLFAELKHAVERAVAMQGVAIWIEQDRVAFTAQLIAKTPAASMFGDLYTDPALRGAGRATRALAAFCTWLMSESDHVALRVGKDNVRAVRLYERVGFTVRDRFMSSLASDAPVLEGG